MRLVLAAALAAAFALPFVSTQNVLTPSQITISYNKPITATATCGEIQTEKGMQPFRETYCSLAGSSQYTPLNAYSYSENDDQQQLQMQEQRNPRELYIEGGHECGYCEANTVDAHPASHMVDGNTSWWQSPPLSRGMQFNQVNITIHLQQEFHVAYVWIQMANSPKPGVWVLEKSVDHGKTFSPWYFFADSDAECSRRFGVESLAPITEDEQIICRSDLASIQPLENGEIMINLLESRPSRERFMSSAALQNFTRATTVRLRLLSTRTLHGHLMDLNERRVATVTRRYFYAIKEILMGGRCVCNGHAKTCDVINPQRPKTLLCRCEHNTCGDMCEQCCPGFVQKKWLPTTASNNFSCEPCNCFGRSNECVYEEELDLLGLSLDIHGEHKGGGRCLNCRFYTEGINCNKCVRGYYRPEDRQWNDTYPCEPCRCDPSRHSGACEELTGKCECHHRFTGPECTECAPGYHSPPECLPCECSLEGTEDQICRPTNGTCPCKKGYCGDHCDHCEDGFTNSSQGCVDCGCNLVGSVHSTCDANSGDCVCKSQFAAKKCSVCALGFYDFPTCKYCDCDPSGTENGVCDASSGQCLCKLGFVGKHCEQCDLGYYGYPNCKSCGCTGSGAQSEECDGKTGECNCAANFTGRICDKCAAGFFDYPLCRECSCLQDGAKGLTCDQNGQCFCKSNFEGERCDRCKANFYNFPVCEECNCHPAGVTADFAGCDKVAPGELCSCRKNVQGRICDECKPTFWDLQFYHREGCVDCKCNVNGTLSRLGTCSSRSGQCLCKKNVGGRNCDRCAPGFFNLRSDNPHGCEPCKCDMGGAVSGECDGETGQCKCRPRVTGLRCDQPIENHFFPTLWHHLYEAEDGRSLENRPVRFASDKTLFPEFSWRGFAVFSPIQDEIILDVDIPKASVYRLLFKLHNPSSVPINAVISLSPLYTNANDVEQAAKLTVPPSSEPFVAQVKGKPFVLNPGKWALSIKTKQRLFLDYAVLIPSEYYEASSLVEQHTGACEAKAGEDACLHMQFPPLPVTTSTHSFFSDDGQPLSQMPEAELPVEVGEASIVPASDKSQEITAQIDIADEDDYVFVMEYFSEDGDNLMEVEISQGNETRSVGETKIHRCPYSSFCRELVTSSGQEVVVHLSAGSASLLLRRPSGSSFGLSSVSGVRLSEWSSQYIYPVGVCIRREGVCQPLLFPPAASSVTTEAEAGQRLGRPIQGDTLPFNIANAHSTTLVALDSHAPTLEVAGVVPLPTHYMVMLHYFNADNAPINLKALLTSHDHFYETSVPLAFCPSVGGCRALFREEGRPEVIQFYLEEKFTLQLYGNDSQKGAIFVDDVTIVPYDAFSLSLLTPLPLDLSADFIDRCSQDDFYNDPSSSNTSAFCKERIFSLTTHFNGAAMPCECSSHGSTSFACTTYGGQCECKENIIGRRCDRCTPGRFGFPDCQKCRCGEREQCNEQTGQCFCPQHVEGRDCDRCVSYAFGFDRLIGCQKCGCHPQGSHSGSLLCDAISGQCLCKDNVAGRRCDSCLAGFYGFPYCHECRCHRDGTTEEICDATTASCKCKENVMGAACESCVAGTFALSSEHERGCIECFCFSVTDHCVSSDLPIFASSIDMTAVKVTDESGSVAVDEGNQVIYIAGESAPKVVYFDIPVEQGKDYTTSYGLVLHYTLSCNEDKKGKKQSTSEPDLVLSSSSPNLTAEFWAFEQPADPSTSFGSRVKLNADSLLHPSGRSLSREEVMLLLHSLSSIRLKASYWQFASSARLIDFSLESVDENIRDVVIRAKSVERCGCPSAYTGLSCQECATGFYRLRSSDSSGLGSCVPCECNGHSGSCDPATGVCFGCQHNTKGDHCEKCEEGYHGDPSSGSPYACSPCQCPYPPYNNFASSCTVSDEGLLVACHCKAGYSGERCDLCDSGYFGDPTASGGACQPCNCNGNNDLSDAGACHPVQGTCFLCQNNTYGSACELCAPWYFGDAVVAKDCSACECDQCGSRHCDHLTGQCTCKENVVGSRCHQCAPDHFGFSSCRGCEVCSCAAASSSTQCHSENGQCPCRPGAAGRRCEQCDHGYWNYGEHGCTKCDCEADLSLGTVCDVQTGQCHCQEGATGSRCSRCLPGFLRIPGHGCRRCDECVNSLKADVESVSERVDLLSSSISNISASAIDGARLSRSNLSLTLIKEAHEALLDLESPEANSRGSVVKSVLEDNAITALEAETLAARSDSSSRRALALIDEGNTVMSDAQERMGLSLAVVDSLRDLEMSLEVNAGSSKAEWIEEAEEVLRRILQNDVNITSKIDAHKVTMAALDERLKGAAEKRGKMVQMMLQSKEKFNTVSMFMKDTNDTLAAVEKSIKDVGQKTKWLDPVQSNRFMKFKSMTQSLEDDERDIKKLFEQLQTKTEEVKESTEESMAFAEKIRELLGLLKGKKLPSAESRVKRDESINLEELKEKAASLEKSSAAISETFEPARVASHSAVQAAAVYSDISEAIAKARRTGEEAGEHHQDSKDAIQELKNDVANALDDSKNQLAALNEVREDGIQQLHSQLQSVTEKSNAIAELLGSLKKRNELVSNRPAMNETLTATLEKISKAEEKIIQGLGEQKTTISELKKSAEESVKSALRSNNDIETAKKNLIDMDARKERLPQQWAHQMANLTNGVKRMEKLREQLRSLSESLAVARATAEKVPLAAHFERGSSVNAHLQQPITHSSLATDISFLMQTSHDGTPLYLGNVEGQEREFIAVEVVDGRPAVTIQLGDQPLRLALSTRVDDGEWHRLGLSRLGPSLSLSLLTPDGRVTRETRSDVSKGRHSLLNLKRKSAKLFVGGIPPQFSIPLAERNFVGNLAEVVLNGEIVGLWSVNERGLIGVSGATKPPSAQSPFDKEVGLSGDGFLNFKIPMFWNPREKVSLTLSFRSFAPDALLFYVGKDSDFMSLELSGGVVKMAIDFGKGVTSLATEQTFNDGAWHTILLAKDKKKIRIQVDEEVHEGEVTGEIRSDTLGHFLYLGGIPLDVHTRATVEPLKGCLRSVRLDSAVLDLQRANRSKGISVGCPDSLSREVSLLSGRSSASFSNISLSKGEPSVSFDFSLRFKTKQPDAVIATVKNDDEEQLLSLSLSGGSLRIGSSESESFPLGISQLHDNLWHYVSVRKEAGSSEVVASLDDVYFASLDKLHLDIEPFELYTLHFGKQAAGEFVGCIRDVSFAGSLLDFSKANRREVRLTGCAVKEEGDEEKQKEAEKEGSPHEEAVAEYESRPTYPDVCALDVTAGDEMEKDKTADRFGLEPFSHLRFGEPGTFDQAESVSLWARIEAASGPLVYIAGRKPNDHFGLFLVDGIVQFSFNSPSGIVKIRSAKLLTDRRWHFIKATRKANLAFLSIDGEIMESAGEYPVESADVEFPVHVGGFDNATGHAVLVRLGLETVRAELSGCLSEVELNGRRLTSPSFSLGVSPCGVTSEPGVFLGKDGGYGILPYDEPMVTFRMEIDFRARVSSGLILSIGKVEFLSLALEDGNLVLLLKTAEKQETKIIAKSAKKFSLCDGHWHHVKLFRKKNLLTMSVDGKSNMKIGKRAGNDFALKDPILIGKPAKGMVNEEVLKQPTFVGCVRVLKGEGEELRRMRRETRLSLHDVPLSQFELVGDASLGCPAI